MSFVFAFMWANKLGLMSIQNCCPWVIGMTAVLWLYCISFDCCGIPLSDLSSM